jgi:hypothetical protein
LAQHPKFQCSARGEGPDTGRPAGAFRVELSGPSAEAPPDGYTFLMAYDPNAVNTTLHDKLNFNFIRDRTHRGHRPSAKCHGGQSILSGQDGARVYSLCKG